ncbi:MAG TPA: type II toxin-antitoxin system VapC family toxin [Flavobacteriales bacterium]|nr:type II toxin-antitoxin system VapC family toxin [Flavobacteriales bacterium]HRN36042.1 type II toxin-antitoxin system VapC family toxin [Flavobacteriales bacterium]HRO40947.1 type II toxin-antitoxin system VapC family toxin [Flavobacteriales bacterium]HRP81559.1 type II toxin-antitoxin system VapC family toxin [Flavobacteriales bacterium]HRQ84764.1 type II toxin-antitoxin system VapC family toxin [Flavobacteriales bacterium]
MVILLDTHFVIWALAGDGRISKAHLKLLEDPGQLVRVSLASIWEITIKLSIGKLKLQASLPETMHNIRALGFGLLPMEEQHFFALSALPHHHRDPFDRMLIAQAKHEGMHILTADKHFKTYDVKLVGG